MQYFCSRSKQVLGTLKYWNMLVGSSCNSCQCIKAWIPHFCLVACIPSANLALAKFHLWLWLHATTFFLFRLLPWLTFFTAFLFFYYTLELNLSSIAMCSSIFLAKFQTISYNFSSLAYLVQLPVSISYFIPNVFPCFISSGWFCYPFSRCNSEYYSGHVPTLQSSHSRGIHRTYERWSTSEWRLLLRCTDMHWDEAIDALSCVFLVTTPIRHLEHDVIFPVPW